MLAGYYTIASGMMTNQKKIDTLGNNVVNAQTPGYKAERVVTSTFEKELLTRREGEGSEVLGDGTGSVMSYVDDVVTLFTMGNLNETEREGDFAIGGAGFFNIQLENGQTVLTRNGGFNIDEEGYLELPGYGRVLGENGPLKPDKAGFSATQDGQLFASDGSLIGKFLITVPAEGATMERLDNGMFTITAGGAQNADGNYSLIEKTLELSNLNLNEEMTSLMQAQRAFQTCSSALQIVDSMNTKAATKIGAV